MIAQLNWAQKFELLITDSIPGKFDVFSVDNLGRISLVSQDVIVQYNSDLSKLFTASLKTIRPTSIESSKSFRTLLFDQDRSVVQFLDNTLTNLYGDIDLVNLDIQQPILVCESFSGNNFWVLDAASLRLIKLDEKLNQVSITENLVDIFDDISMPTQMKESNDYLYIMIPDRGVALFDIFGTFMKLYPCKPTNIDAIDGYLLVQSENSLEVIKTKKLIETSENYTLPDGVKDFVYTHKCIYLLTDKGLMIGEFKAKR